MIASADATLICTLGGQPQVVTFALDYLLGRGESIAELVVVHLAQADERIRRSLDRLSAEFEGDHYHGRPIRFRSLGLRRQGRPLTAIRTAADAETARLAAHQLITDLKRRGQALHLCIAGGPRMLALMILSGVMLHCGHQDKVWHMYTEPDFLERAKRERLLHDERGDQVWLVEVPVVPWGAYFSPLLNPAANPTQHLHNQVAWLDQADQRRCAAVWEQVTARQREVLRAFAGGRDAQGVAEQLHISLSTVHHHKTQILAECRIAWELPESAHLSYHFLADKFRHYATSE